MFMTVSVFSVCLVLYALLALYRNLCKRIDAFHEQYAEYQTTLKLFGDRLNNVALALHHFEEKNKDMTDQILAVGGNTRLIREDMVQLLNHVNRLWVETLDMTCGPTSKNAKSQTNWKGQL